MKLDDVRERLSKRANRYPVSATAYDLAYKSVNRLTLLMVLKCLTIDTVDEGFLQRNESYTYEFLDAERLRALRENPEYEMKRDFLEDALGKGDECFAILDGDRLASYGWYSTKPTKVNQDLEIDFDDRYVYMYKGFTHPSYRGQRLHAIGMTMALKHYLDRGHRGIVSWVEANNVSSLRSCYRMGYEDFGEIRILKLFRKHFIRRSEGCKEYGVTVSAIPRRRG
jgi:ribosomal protein S18 acetylase RimI-like enzyme